MGGAYITTRVELQVFFFKNSTSKIKKENTSIHFYLKLSLNYAVKRASEQVCFLLGAQVLTFRL